MATTPSTKEIIDNLFPKTEDEVPAQYRVSYWEQREYVIDGKILKWAGEMQDVVSPILVGGKQKVIGQVPMLDSAQALAALDAAVRAYGGGFGEWPKMTVGERIKHMICFVNQIKQQRDKVVNLLMWEIGKTLADSQKEFDRTVQYIVDTIEALKDLDRQSSRFQMQEGIIGQIRRAPLGVCLCMGPFNYPWNELMTTLIPAILMGNTIIMKPAKYGVLLHAPILAAYSTCFPPGVFNVVYGDGPVVVGPLMTSGKIDCLAFIGSCRVADLLKKQHPSPHRMRAVLGLEAKNPAIVLADADLKNAVNECVLGTLSFNGQRCTALKTIFVHHSIKDQFEKMFVEAVEKLKPGLPWTPGANLTPLPEPDKAKWMNDYVQDAIAKGGRVLNPTGGYTNKTFFFPVVIGDANSSMKICQEEQFGPATPIISFADIAEPIKFVKESKYGQQVAIFGQNPETLSAMVDSFVNQVCRVNINSQCQRGPDVYPFTGRKDSAEGTLSVSDALRVFSIRTLVACKATDTNKDILTTVTHKRSSKFLNTDYIF